MMKSLRRYLPFLPSLLTGLVGAVWLSFFPLDYGAPAGLLTLALTAAALTVGLLGGAWGLERTLPSFRYASGLLERALAQLRPSGLEALLFAALTAGAEELFFPGCAPGVDRGVGPSLRFRPLTPDAP